MRKCCALAFDDAFAIALGLNCAPGLATNARYSFDEVHALIEGALDTGFYRGCVVGAAIIAWGEAIRVNHGAGEWDCGTCGHINPSCAAWCVKSATHERTVDRAAVRTNPRRKATSPARTASRPSSRAR